MGDVSSATVDAVALKATQIENCKVDQVAKVDGVVKFTRLDDRLPLPVPAESVKALDAAPILNDLSRYLLTVSRLLGFRKHIAAFRDASEPQLRRVGKVIPAEDEFADFSCFKNLG